MLTLAAAGGAASVGGIALPGRCDEVIRVRRRPPVPQAHVASFGAVALSLFLLGLIDSAAMSPLASVALSIEHVGGWLQAGLMVVVVAGVAAAAVVLTLPRLTADSLLARFQVRSLDARTTRPRRVEALLAWGAVATSWVLRSLATFVLLAALGLGTDFALALAFVCASAASAVLPVAPAGAAVQAGAGAAILVAAGVRSERRDCVRHRGAGARDRGRRDLRARARSLARPGALRACSIQQVADDWQVRSTRTDGVPLRHVSLTRTDAASLSYRSSRSRIPALTRCERS